LSAILEALFWFQRPKITPLCIQVFHVEQFLENLHAMDSQISGVHKKLAYLLKPGGMHFLLERVA